MMGLAARIREYMPVPASLFHKKGNRCGATGLKHASRIGLLIDGAVTRCRAKKNFEFLRVLVDGIFKQTGVHV